MLKVSITLPNNAQISLESEDSQVIDQILGMVLADVTRALLDGVAAVSVAPAPAGGPMPKVTAAEAVPPPFHPQSVEQEPAGASSVGVVSAEGKGNPRPAGQSEEPPPNYPEQSGSESTEEFLEIPSQMTTDWDNILEEPPDSPWPELEDVGPSTSLGNGSHSYGADMRKGPASVEPAVSKQAFVDFCRAANPLGDMRRVVVAAEGASRYLAMDGVDAEALGLLFDTVGWPRAHNFVQTLRNAARSKFGWLERIPGRAGHYTVTELGRSTALGR